VLKNNDTYFNPKSCLSNILFLRLAIHSNGLHAGAWPTFQEIVSPKIKLKV